MNFWKKNDYNLILEKILDSKYFSSETKSLLLSMIYKIEEFYKDYKCVKNIDTTKDEFLNLILETVKKYCDNVKLIQPEENDILKKNKVLALTNEKERSVLCYPTESSILYAISDIMPKYFFISDEFEHKESFQRTLVNGYNLNTLEILSDFNGWSWDSNVKGKNNFQDYLIYQNLVTIFGSSFLEDWKEKKAKDNNYFNDIKKYFAKTKYFDYLCRYLNFGLTNKEKNKSDKELAVKIKNLEILSDKITYFEKIKVTKLKYLKELEKITLSLNNRELLKKEYTAKNLKLTPEKKIATLGAYKKILEERKEKVVNKISELTASMNPINYMNTKRELEKYIEINSKECGNKDEIFINIQEEFIKALRETCLETEDIESLKNLIFKIRYYKYLYVTEDKQIKDVASLNEPVNDILKEIINKLANCEKIKIISKDNSVNQEIICNILETKVIDLESLKFEICINEGIAKIKTYEKEVFEKEFEIIGNFSKKSFCVKQGKIYKLFL